MSESIIVIESATEAYEYLRAAFANQDTRKVSINARKDGVAVKVNEDMWTHTMRSTWSS